jgi:hypothetical protein
MAILILKLLLTPTLIGLASLAGRRWGPSVSGWLVALPLTSGPVTLFLALSHGTAFAAAAALGTLTGTLSQPVFCLTYAWVALRCNWLVAFLAGVLAFAACTAALQYLVLPPGLIYLAANAALALGFLLMPKDSSVTAAKAPPPPRWDIPARMVLATAFILVLTGLASALGPRLTGLIAPFPLYVSILAVFAHRLQGAASAINVLRGLLLGLFGFATFFLLLSLLLEPAGIALAFLAAIAAALALQGVSLWAMQRIIRYRQLPPLTTDDRR